MMSSHRSFGSRLTEYQLTDSQQTQPQVSGQLVRVVGMTLEVIGLELSIGCRCLVINEDQRSIEAEVVGFSEKKLFLMPKNLRIKSWVKSSTSGL